MLNWLTHSVTVFILFIQLLDSNSMLNINSTLYRKYIMHVVFIKKTKNALMKIFYYFPNVLH